MRPWFAAPFALRFVPTARAQLVLLGAVVNVAACSSGSVIDDPADRRSPDRLGRARQRAAVRGRLACQRAVHHSIGRRGRVARCRRRRLDPQQQPR